MRRLFLVFAFLTAAVFGAEPKPEKVTASSKIEGQVFTLLNEGKQSDAEELLDEHLMKRKYSQRELFLRGVLTRSRFSVRDAAMIFAAVGKMDEKSTEGSAATCVLNYDKGKDTDTAIGDLKKLAGSNPDDVFIQWLLAIMCRAARNNDLGIEQYKKVLAMWDPGPVLVHQSYANMLDAVEKYEAALVERQLAVKLEPAGWSYDGLANTLTKLERYKEAEQAHLKATSIDPKRGIYWANWAYTLKSAGRMEEAVAKCKKATEVDPMYAPGWSIWGQLLEEQGKMDEASAKYTKALEANPVDPRARHYQARKAMEDYSKLSPEEREDFRRKLLESSTNRPPQQPMR